MSRSVRIDKYLWAVRIYKTRSLAAEACKKGRVSIGDMPVKASRLVGEGEVIQVKKMPVLYSYLVKDPIEKRVGAKIVHHHVEDITPEEEVIKLKMQDDFFVKRERGAGRPTKKDRRLMDGLTDPD